MTKRLPLLGLAWLCVCSSAMAQLQPGRPFGPNTGRPPGVSPTRPTAPGQPRQNVNERHERAKSEAQSASLKGDHEHALSLVETVLKENPKDDVALYLRASSRVEIGRQKRDVKLLRDGVADARQAISLKQRENSLYYLPYLFGMSNLATAENRPEHAEVAAKVAQQIVAAPGLKDEERANIQYQLGVAHMAMKDEKAAAQDFEAVIRLIPNHVGAHMAVSDAYLRSGDGEKAAASFDRAVKAMPKSPLVYNNRGMFRESQGNAGGAIEDFTQAIELDETFNVALTNRGYSLLSQGNVGAAETDFTASLAANPNQDMVYSFRGAARLAQGKLDAATSDFTRLVERMPTNPVGWSELGFARYFAGDYQGALKAFDQASTIDPKLRYLNSWRYQAMAANGVPERDLEAFAEKNSVELKDDDWAGGLFAFATGRMTDEELLKRVDAKSPRNSRDQTCEAHFFIAQKLTREGKTDEAAKHYEKALETGARYLSAYRGAQFALKKFPMATAGS